MMEAKSHQQRTHGGKFRCPDLNCNFIFPECYWETFEEHNATHLFDMGEPIPVAQRKRKNKCVEETDKVKVTKKNPQLSIPSDPNTDYTNRGSSEYN